MLLAVLSTIAWVLYMAPQMVKNQQATMARFPNGVAVRFLGTAVGNTVFTTEKWWETALRRVLPASLTRWVPYANRGVCSSGTNSTTVYVRLTSPTGTTGRPEPWARYVAEDDTGFRYPMEAGGCSFSSGGASQVNGLILRAHPRRQRKFWVRFLDVEDRVLASLRVPNPVQGPFAEWEPVGLPQTVSNGPVTLTLRSLGRGDKPWERVRPEWKLISTDAAWEKAGVTSSTLMDPTGNEGPWLSEAEKAWKIRACVARQKMEQFSNIERLTVTDLPLPAPGEFQSIDASRNLDDVQVNAQLIAGPGRLTVSNGVYRSMEEPTGNVPRGHSSSSGSFGTVETWGPILKPFLMLTVSGMRDGDELRFRLSDSDGRHEDLETSNYSRGPGNSRVYTPQFDADRLSAPLRLEVALSRPLVFEFLVSPAQMNPANLLGSKPDRTTRTR